MLTFQRRKQGMKMPNYLFLLAAKTYLRFWDDTLKSIENASSGTLLILLEISALSHFSLRVYYSQINIEQNLASTLVQKDFVLSKFKNQTWIQIKSLKDSCTFVLPLPPQVNWSVFPFPDEKVRNGGGISERSFTKSHARTFDHPSTTSASRSAD